MCPQEKLEQVMLIEIPPPGSEQLSGVTAALEEVVLEHGMTDEDVEKRRGVVALMQDLLLSVLPGISPRNSTRIWFSAQNKAFHKTSHVCRDQAQVVWIILH